MSGMTTQKAISSRIPAHTPMGPIDNAGNRPQPIYTGSERSIHRGFNTRRTVTDSMVGWNSPGSRLPHRLAQRFHPLEFDELSRRRPQIIAVQEGLE